jgi:hypothetical protein
MRTTIERPIDNSSNTTTTSCWRVAEISFVQIVSVWIQSTDCCCHTETDRNSTDGSATAETAESSSETAEASTETAESTTRNREIVNDEGVRVSLLLTHIHQDRYLLHQMDSCHRRNLRRGRHRSLPI